MAHTCDEAPNLKGETRLDADETRLHALGHVKLCLTHFSSGCRISKMCRATFVTKPVREGKPFLGLMILMKSQSE